MPKHSGWPRSPDTFEVGAHHVGHSAYLGETPDVVDGGLAARTGVFQRLQRHIQTDLVAVLEAVRHGLGHAVHAEPDTVAFDLLNPCRVGIARELHHLDGRVVDTGRVAAPRHGDPDLTRQLRGQLMKLQRREQAEHRLRYLGGDGAKALEFRNLCIRQTVQATPHLLQQTRGGQARQNDPRRTDGVQIAGAQQPLLAGQFEDALSVGTGVHG